MRAALLLWVLLAASASAGTAVTVPGDVGVGPAAYFLFGKVATDQAVFAGLKVNVSAVLDSQWLKDNQETLPPAYRKYMNGVDEISVTPSLFIPDSLIISPKVNHTSLYGVTWKPLAISLPLTTGTVRLRVNAGLDLTYAYLASNVLPTTHFIRPGAELGLDVRFRITPSFFINLGWESQLYVPQELGALGLGSPSDWIFHIGQAYLQVHFRFPYAVEL